MWVAMSPLRRNSGSPAGTRYRVCHNKQLRTCIYMYTCKCACTAVLHCWLRSEGIFLAQGDLLCRRGDESATATMVYKPMWILEQIVLDCADDRQQRLFALVQLTFSSALVHVHVAQLVEFLPRTQCAVGLNPTQGSFFQKITNCSGCISLPCFVC